MTERSSSPRPSPLTRPQTPTAADPRSKRPVSFAFVPALLALAGSLSLSFAACAKPAKTPAGAPANAPAAVKIEAGRISMAYGGKEIFSGEIAAPGINIGVKTDTFRNEDAVTEVVVLTVRDGVARLTGVVQAGAEAFPCEADRRERGPALVRHVSGLSESLLNRAVYDRGGDWLLSVDAGPRVVISPPAAGAADRTFGVLAEGAEIVLRFRPRYYQIHRGLRYYEPWTYRTWPVSVAGWISWFAFLDKVTEADILRTAEVQSEVLLPFGYDVLQIDDGYQKGEGLPELWLQANAKFPRGLEFLARAIKNKGLTPGIWTNVAFKQAEFAEAHPDWFVTGPLGRPARGNWVQFSLDASNPKAVDAVVRPVYRGLRSMGWEYFKVDALRHLRYEGYNAEAGYFEKKKIDLTRTFRSYVEAIRGEIGRGVFMLGCWGIRPELIGLIDGCRIGTDGFSYAGLAQFNSWNNVVWRNDPDHIELNEDRFRSTLVTSLTGSILLLTDKPELYRTEAVEPARRAAPVLRTVPGQVFDVDASRSAALGRVDAEVSGSGPRVFDAGLAPACDLFLLEICRPFENWLALGRTGGSVRNIRFADLGLDPGKEYFVFEFWSKKLAGSFTGGFEPGPLDPVFRCQDFIIRERAPHPQILATSRHVSGGGADLLAVHWSPEGGGVLEGSSRIVGQDPYTVYLTAPEGFVLDRFEADTTVAETRREGIMTTVTLLSDRGRVVRWSAKFRTRTNG